MLLPHQLVTKVIADKTAVVRLNRPSVRNALSGEVLLLLRQVLNECDADSNVRVIILTGADPAFCAGLDLRAFAEGDPVLVSEASTKSHLPWQATRKPVIGAINGPAVAGGLELALNCDILIASDRATFADTHARVAVMPGWGLSPRLFASVGRSLALWMSLSGRPIDAQRALIAGLVSDVVPHEELMVSARSLAHDIAESHDIAVEALLDSYRRIELAVYGTSFDVETAAGQEFRQGDLSLSQLDSVRKSVIDRGRELHAQNPGS
jgi:enoyl-CoA hydratase